MFNQLQHIEGGGEHNKDRKNRNQVFPLKNFYKLNKK